MVIVIIFEHPFGIKISIYNTLLGYHPLLDQYPKSYHIVSYEPLSPETVGADNALITTNAVKMRQSIRTIASGVICVITMVLIQFAKLEIAPPRVRMRVVDI